MNFSVRNPGGKKDSWSCRGKSAEECKTQHGTNLFRVSQGGIFLSKRGKVSRPQRNPINPCCSISRRHPQSKSLPGSPHGPGVGNGGRAEALPALQALGAALVVLAVGLVQVGAKVLTGHCGGGRREHGGRGAGQTPSSGGNQGGAKRIAGPSATVATRSVADEVHQHVLEVVLIQGHALEQVVEELRRHGGVYPRTAGHEHVDLMHALDVAGCKPLTGFSVECVCFCEGKEKETVRHKRRPADRLQQVHIFVKKPQMTIYSLCQPLCHVKQ